MNRLVTEKEIPKGRKNIVGVQTGTAIAESSVARLNPMTAAHP